MKLDLSFSPDEFKKWMETHTPHQMDMPNPLIGTEVESKITGKRLAIRMKPKDGRVHDMVEDFMEKGGTIYDVQGREFLIEVTSGFFLIPRYLVKKKA